MKGHSRAVVAAGPVMAAATVDVDPVRDPWFPARRTAMCTLPGPHPTAHAWTTAAAAAATEAPPAAISDVTTGAMTDETTDEMTEGMTDAELCRAETAAVRVQGHLARRTAVVEAVVAVGGMEVVVVVDPHGIHMADLSGSSEATTTATTEVAGCRYHLQYRQQPQQVSTLSWQQHRFCVVFMCA